MKRIMTTKKHYKKSGAIFSAILGRIIREDWLLFFLLLIFPKIEPKTGYIKFRGEIEISVDRPLKHIKGVITYKFTKTHFAKLVFRC